MVEIAIYIRGGNLQYVVSNEDIKYKLIDFDNDPDANEETEEFIYSDEIREIK